MTAISITDDLPVTIPVELNGNGLPDVDLQASEMRYRRLFEAARDGILILDAVTLKITDVNPFMLDLLGYPYDEFLGKELWEIGFFSDRSASQDAFRDLQLTGYLRYDDIPLRTTDGKIREVEFISNVYEENGRPVIQCNIRDITERKHSDVAQSALEERYHTLFEYAPDGIIIASPDSYYLDANSSMCRMLGYTRDELIGLHASDIVTASEVEHIGEALTEIEERAEYHREWQFKRKDGSTFSGEVMVTMMPDRNLLAMIRDVTERRGTEAALEESEASFKSLFNTANDAILVISDGVYLTCNQSAQSLFGCEKEKIIGSSPLVFSPHEQPDGRLSSEKMAEYLEAAMIGHPQFFEWRHARLDGTPFDAEVSLNRVDFRGKTHIQSTIHDITLRKELEEQFRQSQKMEAVGVLAGGIAHDFNNLLTAIAGYSGLTLKRMPIEDPLRQNIEEIKTAGERAAELTGQLLAFSRKQVLKPRVYNLNTAISEIEKMLRRIIRESIEFRVTLAPDLGNIKADSGQIEQVIMNLAINARDAMPNGGTLTLETQNVYLDSNYVSQHIAISPGRFVKMTITDTGVGMDEVTRGRIFEPFFTTKEVGKGTGLGLSTVHGIVKQSGGDILVYSELGHGTIFKIFLPCVDEMVQEQPWVDEGPENLSGTETILLVEDEEIVRNLAREILVSNGYNVLEAASGIEALSMCEAYTEPIHLLLSDVIMPAMGGSTLKPLMLKQRPGIKMLFMSGYADHSITGTGLLESNTPFIEKPFTPDALARKVRAVLES